MEFSLESPGSAHFTSPEDNQDTWKRDKRRKNPSTLRRDKKRAEQRRAQAAGPVPDAGHAQHAVEEHERADREYVRDDVWCVCAVSENGLAGHVTTTFGKRTWRWPG